MFLGVDGGGTKTALCLLDPDGTVRARALTAGSYHFAEGFDRVGEVLREGVAEVCERAGAAPGDVRYAFFGLPGYGESSADVSVLDALPRPALGHDRYACDNDVVAGWAGSLATADGINVVAGTGSIAYGERAGRRARAGGWGEVFGDEGSAYWVAVRGLQAFARMSDGRAAAGPLLELLREHLALPTDLDLVDVVLSRWDGGRAEIAALCPVVVEAARRGDAAAARVLADAGRELADLVVATRARLGFEPGETVPVSHSGGVFAADLVREHVGRELAALDGGYELRRPLHEPVVGAALHAAVLAGEPLGETALARLRGADDDVAPPGGGTS